jgi:metal-dependent hydrolase (beta-lactamase superfamily II)
MLPAQRGDCLWLTYGKRGDLHHVIIDGGPQETIPTLLPMLEERIHRLNGTTNRVELLVVSHVDADHIQGVVSLLSKHQRVRLFDDIWFNGYRHLSGLLGGPDGERLTAALNTQPKRWNKAFRGAAVVIPDKGPLPTVTLNGGLEITVLAPGRTALTRLMPQWEKACEKAGILPGQGAEIAKRTWKRDALLGFKPDVLAKRKYTKDTSRPNATSIACIAKYENKRVLLLADAPTEAVIAGLKRLGPGPHKFSAVKLSHHGSQHDTNLELCQLISSKRWLVSTNGAVFEHPDPESLARIVTTQDKPELVFNYVTEFITDVIRGAGQRYTVKLPKRHADGSYGEGNTVSI